jgi:hypothetical protein
VLAPPVRLGYHAGVRTVPLALVLLASCAAPQRPPGDPAAEAAGAALSRFVAAVDQGHWPEAWSLLSAQWRGRETPERLAVDLAASGPVGASAVARARAALAAGILPDVRDRAAALAVGGGRAVALVLEDGSWRVDALE